MIVFYNTIVLVKDLKISKYFYETIIGLNIEKEYESIIFFENHFVVHDSDSLIKTKYNVKPSTNRKMWNKNILIYFETDDIEQSYEKIQKNKIKIIHPIKKQEWNQKVFRFYDPDNHMIEIGEATHLEYLKKG